MTARRTASLLCDRETRPPVDGMRTICGLEFGPASMSAEQLRHVARDYGWAATGTSDYCPQHATARQEERA